MEADTEQELSLRGRKSGLNVEGRGRVKGGVGQTWEGGREGFRARVLSSHTVHSLHHVCSWGSRVGARGWGGGCGCIAKG